MKVGKLSLIVDTKWTMNYSGVRATFITRSWYGGPDHTTDRKTVAIKQNAAYEYISYWLFNSY